MFTSSCQSLNSCMQTDLEEAKTQEIAKLQHSLQAMQSKIDETNVLLVKEREAAKKAIEEAPPVIKETPVFIEDTKKVESLRAEVDSLKVTLLSCGLGAPYERCPIRCFPFTLLFSILRLLTSQKKKLLI